MTMGNFEWVIESSPSEGKRHVRALWPPFYSPNLVALRTSVDDRTHGEAVQLTNASQRTVELEVQHLGEVQWQNIQRLVSEGSQPRSDSVGSSGVTEPTSVEIKLCKRGRQPLGMALSAKAHKVIPHGVYYSSCAVHTIIHA